MLNNRIKAIKSHNNDLVMAYMQNYEDIDQMYGAYKNYSSLLLDWAGDRDILKAPNFRIIFPDYLTKRITRDGKQYSENYIYSSCLFARDFFRYCKAVLPEEDTELINDFWLKSLVPIRLYSKRLSFNWLTDEELLKILNLRNDKNRIQRAKAAILFTAVTGISRGALLTIPIQEIDFDRMIVHQYPEHGVYTEKLVSGVTHIYPDEEIIKYLKKYTDDLKHVSPVDCTWFIRLNRHGNPQPAKFGSINQENQKNAYQFALSPYGKLREDLATISEMCKIPKISLSICQNTFIYKRLKDKRIQKLFNVSQKTFYITTLHPLNNV